MMLFNNANRGASGKAATKMVTKPYCITEMKNEKLSLTTDRILLILFLKAEDAQTIHMKYQALFSL